MKITIEEVNYIAKLAKLSLTEEETKKMAEEFEGILTNFESLNKFDLSDIDLNYKDENLKPLLRKDETSVFEDKKKLFQNVKSLRDNYIEVPKIIE
ncbi:MAG: Asp-tRNA(Asn)/Glu-tRNA(Gln) amidotransferase subunit GatC [Bacillota bacterium]|nr:Asp-tRNA(Asn)/Glu-tRNA(Gln) amidotransferase subunit GatC [Bacillota bacterium]